MTADGTSSNWLSLTRRQVLRFRRPIAVVLYFLMAWAANALAFVVRFDGRVPAAMWHVHASALPWLLLLRMSGFMAFGRFRGLGRYPSIYDLRDILAAVATSSAVFFVLVRLILGRWDYPRSVYVIDGLLLIALLAGFRLSRRAVDELRRKPGSRRILIVGAGNAGEMIARDMRQNPDYDYDPVGFIDDASGKQGERIQGVPVLGTLDQVARIVEDTKPADVLIAMPSAPPAVVQKVVRDLQPFHLRITTLPSLREIVDGRVSISEIRNLAIEDLLARPPVGLDPDPVRRLVSGRRVMVTGAGGSIGSELCRQVAAFGPASLVLVERHENSLFSVTNELQDTYPHIRFLPVVADVCDGERLAQVFSGTPADIVFHAAAHKHVPLMEQSPSEAVKNNVFGTLELANAAERWGVERFILISTDKAVNPVSAMGVSKRIAEMIVQAKATVSKTAFAAVRFGNVLGSNGSVVPRFLDQIRKGGPVTVTHPEMRRYFMLIPEAVQLVMHAAATAKGGEVFVLDMGEQMRVADMARTLIRLSGYVPGEDIVIRFTGPRPGEKLSEELVEAEEALEPSGTDKINRLRPKMTVSPAEFDRQLSHLRACAADGDPLALRLALQTIVPSYVPELDNRREPLDEPAVARPGFPAGGTQSIAADERSNRA